MDLDAYFAENPMGGSFPTNPDFKSGFVTLVGRPNAGKSTLLNAIMGKKIAITSNTAQTTRHRFRAVHTTDDMQMIIVDTPGLHKPQDALGEELNTSAIKALEDVDVVAMLIDASKPIGRGDEWVAAQVRAAKGSAKICVLSKTDLASDAEISAQREAAEKLCDWDAMVALYEELGYYKDGIFSLTMKGLDGKEKIGRIMDTLRKNPPKTIGAYTVEASRDYLQDVVCDNRTGEKKETGLPKSNVLYYDLNENSWCCVRPSGTEPKIKIYYGVKGTSMEDADAKMAAIEKALKELVESIS